MRDLFCFAAITIFCISNAQIKTPEKGSEWIYNYSNVNSGGPLVANYTKDTFLSGKNAMVFEKTLYDIYDYFNEGKIDTLKGVGNIISTEDSLVSYLFNEKFDTLYNFAANIGDEWMYAYSSKDTLIASVLGKGTDARLGFYLELEYTSKYFPSRRDTVYEYLLGGTNYIIPWDVEVSHLDGHSGGPLRCFSNNNLNYVSKWWEERNLPCMFLSKKIGIDELNKTNSFTIYPNPSRGSIQIRTNDKEKVRFIQVFDLKGQIVFETEGLGAIENLSPQLYFVRIFTESGTFETHKVLVE
jgi:hypothetical protein